MKKVLVLLLVAALAFTACFNPAPAPPPVQPDPPPAQTVEGTTPTSPPATTNEPITLTVWGGGGEGQDVLSELFRAFTEETGVIINQVTMDGQTMRDTIAPAINAGAGPDLFYSVPGPANIGLLANSGLLFDLTDIANERGWFDRHVPWTLEQNTFNGRLFGIGNEMESLGIFYNRDLFAQAGVSVPRTYAEFLEISQVFADMGITPIMFDTLDQWPGFHFESLWLNSLVGHEAVGAVLRDQAGWNQPEFGAALDSLYELVSLGLTNAAINSLSYDDANMQFLSGNVAMRPTGGWIVNTFVRPEFGMQDSIGFFFLPPGDGISLAAPSGIGQAWAVSARTQHPEVVADFLDFAFTGDRLRMWYEWNVIPSVRDVDPSVFDLQPLFIAYSSVMASVPYAGYNIDVLVPARVNDATLNYMQEIFAGRITGMEAMEIKQDAWRTEIDAGNHIPME